jgi:hypothetical protein
MDEFLTNEPNFEFLDRILGYLSPGRASVGFAPRKQDKENTEQRTQSKGTRDEKAEKGGEDKEEEGEDKKKAAQRQGDRRQKHHQSEKEEAGTKQFYRQ